LHILGVSAFYHDSAAAILHDGEIIAAAQEERFTRKKHDPSFPENAVAFCLQEANVSIDDVDHIVFFDKPFLKFERLLETYVAFTPRGFKSFKMAMPIWLRQKLFQKSLLVDTFHKYGSNKDDLFAKLLFSEHHLSHAASAFYPSPYEEAAILTMDGVGEWATASAAIGVGNKLDIIKEIHFPHSLGLLYSAFTYYIGFRVNSGEYKVMGLAPYGVPRYTDLIYDNLIDIKKDGSFRLNLSFFDYCTGLTMTNKKFDDLFGAPPRKPEDLLTQKHMDIAASIQAVTEDIMLRLATSLRKETGMRNLCLAGGVALNCVGNGKILKENIFDSIWIQPAAGDAGGSLGAALYAHHALLNKPRKKLNGSRDQMNGAYLGPSYTNAEIEQELKESGAVYHHLLDDELITVTAQALADEKAVGWFQGKMEFGPRALGGRSILGDPRSPSMQKTLNLKVKYRESFRPFAPSVLSEDLSDWFELAAHSPYMLLVSDVHKKHQRQMTEEEKGLFGIEKLNVPRSNIPAVTHVDYSARIQTVHSDTNPRYHLLINKFKEMTGCPVLVNTSFNVRGEPIVCTPTDAFKCFMGTEMEVLAIGNCILYKEEQDKSLALDYKSEFELD
jgi:carbamoyltransferase